MRYRRYITNRYKRYIYPAIITIVINAMKENKKLDLSYRRFQDSDDLHITVNPWCVKIYKQRWYLLAVQDGKTAPRVYAFDRITNLQVTRQNFKLPKGFDAEEFFSKFFGIVCDDNIAAENIRLKVWSNQRNYFRTLPLHHSQREVEIQEDWSIFEYDMAPTWDLELELLQYNDNVEVLAPTSLRDMMIEHAWNIVHLYNEG